MIIAFAFGLIGAILVLANNKYLRITKVSVAGFIIASAVAALGINFILNASPETDTQLLFPMFTPVTALTLMHFTRLLYKRNAKKEIIFFIHGLFPVRQEERHVTRLENFITFILLVLSVLIPYLVLKLIQ